MDIIKYYSVTHKQVQPNQFFKKLIFFLMKDIRISF